MLKVLYEDDEILVVIKPAGVESQAAKRFAPDMVSEVKKHLVINKSCTPFCSGRTEHANDHRRHTRQG